MKKIKIALTCLTFALAITGVVAAKENEKKRTTYSVGYASSSGTFYSITLQSSDFDDVSGTITASTQAKIVNGSGNTEPRPIFANQGLTTRVKHIIPAP